MTIEYVKSINDTIHVSIYNFDNKFCHYVSIIQRLHTSPTLNQLCSAFTPEQLETDLAHLLIKPIAIYSHLNVETKDSQGNTGNILSIFTQFDNFFNDFVPKYVDESARNGYVPHFLLIYCYCPLLYHLFPDSFVKIINEVHVDRTEFDVSPSIAEDIITRKNPFVIDKEFQRLLYQWYMQMIESIKGITSFQMEPFCSATLEIFPNKEHTGGHAVTLIYGQSNLEPNVDEYFILDDHNTISKFHDYYNKHSERLYDISIRDVDDIMISAFNKNLHEKCSIDQRCKFSSRVTRYVLCLEHNFLNVTDEVLKPTLKTNIITTPTTVTETELTRVPPLTPSVLTSTLNVKPNYTRIIFIFCLGVLVGIIISVIIVTQRYQLTPKPTSNRIWNQPPSRT